jgi:hypothetical protein
MRLAAASVDNGGAMSLQLDRTRGVGFRMNHSNSAILMFFTAALAVASNDASGQMSMRPQMPPPSRSDMTTRLALSEDQWINSIVDHWTGSQRKSWRSLDRRFRGWVSHLVWVRTSVGRPSGESESQGPHVPAACPVEAFEAPVHSVAESMAHFRNVMPDVNWNDWANIDPGFRALAEWEMSAAHAKAQMSKALKTWWELNSENVQVCLDAPVAREASTSSAPIAQTSIARSSTSLLDQRHEQLERRVRSELSEVDHLIAPEPMKQEAREQVSDAAKVDNYIADVDRHKP